MSDVHLTLRTALSPVSPSEENMQFRLDTGLLTEHQRLKHVQIRYMDEFYSKHDYLYLLI